MSQFLAKPQKFLVRPAPGWADVCQGELLRVLSSATQKYKFSPEVTREDGAIFLEQCDYRQTLEIVGRLTTAFDVEWILASGRVNSRAGWQLFFEKSGLGEIWSDPRKATIHVSAVVSHPVVGTAKDVRNAAVQYLQKHNVKVLESDSDGTVDGRVRIECTKNRSRILVSMGGDPLYRRGYKDRMSGAVAPLAEHHAAACYLWAMGQFSGDISASLVNGQMLLAVPFAGSGTLGFEGTCLLLDVAPALFRERYAFERFSFHPERTFLNIKSRLAKKIQTGTVRVHFGDIEQEVLQALQHNAERFSAKIPQVKMTCIENDFLKSAHKLILAETKVFLALNPPYGERLAKRTGGEKIYRSLGEAIATLERLESICGFVLCGDEPSWRAFLAAMRSFTCTTRHFTHGGIDVRLVAFQSKAVKKADPKAR